MNTLQPQPSHPSESLPTAPQSTLPARSGIVRAKQFVRNHLVSTITVTIAGSLLLSGVSTLNLWNIYRGFRSTVTRQFELEKLSGKIVHLDEVLTMSARMAASTGDSAWEDRYNKFVPELDAAIEKTLANVTDSIRAEASKTDAANEQLVAWETEAFELVNKGQAGVAFKLLMSPEYQEQKAIYAAGVDKVLEQVSTLINQQLQSYQRQLGLSIGFAIVTFPVLLLSWLLVLSAVRDYIRERLEAQNAVERSQTNLQALNERLKEEVKVRKVQEHQVLRESDQLQTDIEHLLDVVCAVEEGDLTTQAEVNDRATGLVGDTLNRLVEELGRVLGQVSVTAQQVSTNSSQQKAIATEVAVNTDQQVHEVTQVLQLTEQVRQSAQSAAAQLELTKASLLTLQTTVNSGQTAVGDMNQEIDILQQGSDRIVQQMKTLGEFVGLADQFVQDQGEIATQTQILALNASLVAARAAEQRDPQQFTVVAREFEAIANQVSELAQQANNGLSTLEERSAQISRVVSDVDVDVQRLGGLVNGFTQGVKQTSQAFANVETVTAEAVHSGERVAQTSQEISQAADSTASAMQAIAQLSTQIAAQSQGARELSDAMNMLSAELMHNIQVFKLPEAPDSEIAPSSDAAALESEAIPVAAIQV